MICHADERNAMILVTGGSGFIGSHTVRALHGLGEPSVVMQRRSGQVPPHLADLPVVAEQADVADLDSLRAIGERHEITGIVHLAGYPAPRGTAGGIEATQGLLDGLLNIARAAAEWGVRRVSLASTLGVYGGIAHSGPLTEDLPGLLTPPHPIPGAQKDAQLPRSKKIAELLGEQLAEATGTEIASLRISGTWGPLGHEDPFFAAPALIHAAASGKPLDLSALLIPPHLGDGLDLCYVKDTGRAIALIQLAGHLQHRTYNIASGRVTTNAEVIAAIREAVPQAALDLPAGTDRPGAALDITRLRQDTGFEPEYDTVRAAAGYTAWLRAGTERWPAPAAVPPPHPRHQPGAARTRGHRPCR